MLFSGMPQSPKPPTILPDSTASAKASDCVVRTAHAQLGIVGDVFDGFVGVRIDLVVA
jgi:hypothetical protein